MKLNHCRISLFRHGVITIRHQSNHSVHHRSSSRTNRVDRYPSRLGLRFLVATTSGVVAVAAGFVIGSGSSSIGFVTSPPATTRAARTSLSTKTTTTTTTTTTQQRAMKMADWWGSLSSSSSFSASPSPRIQPRPSLDQALLQLSSSSTVAQTEHHDHDNEKDHEKRKGVSVVLSWSEIRQRLERTMTQEERDFRKNLNRGIGVGSPLHTLRLFSNDNASMMKNNNNNDSDKSLVVLYRDSASWCPYCQKVWMALEEKQIPYRVEKINMRCYGDKPPEFQRLQPSGNIPVARIHGKVYTQSNDILYALEEQFPHTKPLLPQTTTTTTSSSSSLSSSSDETTAMLRTRAQSLLQLERRHFGAWLSWLTGSSSATSSAKTDFLRVLQTIESELQYSTQTLNGPFFLGRDVSLVDFMFAPFLERMVASVCFYKGYRIRGGNNNNHNNNHQKAVYPYLNAWFDAMETLPSYQLTKSDYYTHAHALPPQLGGCTREANNPDQVRCEAAINGLDDVVDVDVSPKGFFHNTWKLPHADKANERVQQGGGSSRSRRVEPHWAWISPEEARRQAVERVTANHDSIVAFAARGAGLPGRPSVSAPLADPNAIPCEAVQSSVDVMLRIVCMVILEGVHDDAHLKTALHDVSRIIVTTSDHPGATIDTTKEFVQGVIESLQYLRDRVGVPRDMTLPAAEQVRAHLNWSIDGLTDAMNGLDSR